MDSPVIESDSTRYSLDCQGGAGFVGKPASPEDRRAYWAPHFFGAADSATTAEAWGSQAADVAHFYARFGVGVLGMYQEAAWNDGFIAPPVRPLRVAGSGGHVLRTCCWCTHSTCWLSWYLLSQGF